jgi:hypothetical protein
MAAFPQIMLWAWERPENLEFIEPGEAGVAYLDRTVLLREDKVVVRPRMQPLRLPPATKVLAVARIESDAIRPPELSSSQRAEVVSTIARMARRPGISGIQVDFDATASERRFYRELVIDLRRLLPDSVPLSITALASWCLDDNWISGLPADE